MGLPSANTGESAVQTRPGEKVELRRERVWSVTRALQSPTASCARTLKRGPYALACLHQMPLQSPLMDTPRTADDMPPNPFANLGGRENV
jgi:hypothetical protein